MAMLDALELAAQLTGGSISAYETAMCARASAVAADTLTQTDWMHAPGALERIVDMFKQYR